MFSAKLITLMLTKLRWILGYISPAAPTFLNFLFQSLVRGHGLSAFRVRQRTRDEVVESAVCRTASEISAACSAVNNHLSDKPLDLWGSLRKGCRAKTGYEINGGTGWRHDVCLHAASKSSEMAHMNEHLSTYTVLLNQYCDYFFFHSHPLVFSPRRNSDCDIYLCGLWE